MLRPFLQLGEDIKSFQAITPRSEGNNKLLVSKVKVKLQIFIYFVKSRVIRIITWIIWLESKNVPKMSPNKFVDEATEATSITLYSLWKGLGELGEGWLRAGLTGWRLGEVKHPVLLHPLWDPHISNLTSCCRKQCAAAIPDQTEKSFVMVSHRVGLCFVSARRPRPLPGRCLGWIAVWWNATLPSGSGSVGYRNRVLRKQGTQLSFQ